MYNILECTWLACIADDALPCSGLQLVHDTLKAKVHSKKGERPTNGADPHDGTIEDTMTQDQYLHMARTMLGSADRDDARDLAVMLWMMMCAGRGDDARLMFLPDLMAPKILKGIGGCMVCMVAT